MENRTAAESYSPPAASTGLICPSNGARGRKVKPLTVRALLSDNRKSEVRDGATYGYCASPACDVVYFDTAGWIARKPDLIVRVGVKEAQNPVICYCYGYTREDIRKEVQEKGTTAIAEKIRAEVKAGRCRCETKNPSGSCCLGDVDKAAKEVRAGLSQKGRLWRHFAAPLPGALAALLPVGFCPACWPAYAGVLGSLGLGFLLDRAYLLPFTAVLFGVALFALGFRAKTRRGRGPLILGSVGAGMMLAFKFVYVLTPLAYAGLSGFIAASIWNAWPEQENKADSCPKCVEQEPRLKTGNAPQSLRRCRHGGETKN